MKWHCNSKSNSESKYYFIVSYVIQTQLSIVAWLIPAELTAFILPS